MFSVVMEFGCCPLPQPWVRWAAMALLAQSDNERPYTLSSHCLVGRSPACNLRLDDPRVSGEHARISWHGDRWVLRDLGSRNGTFLNGQLLESASTATLSAGDRIAFGHISLAFHLIDASAPVAIARHLTSGALTVARDGIIALPDPDRPQAMVFEAKGGQWTTEIDGETSPAKDGTVLSMGPSDAAYMLHLPMGIDPTADVRRQPQRIQDVDFRLRVSPDEERVEVFIEGAAGTRMLSPRSHYYSFLTLARVRLKHDAEQILPEPARGWLPVSELCRMLALEESRLNVDIYRIRRDLAELDFLQNPAAVIERKRGQLRVGTRRIAVQPLE